MDNSDAVKSPNKILWLLSAAGSWLFALIGLPFVLQIVLIIFDIFLPPMVKLTNLFRLQDGIDSYIIFAINIISILFCFFFMFKLGHFVGKKRKINSSYQKNYLPSLCILFYTLGIWVIFMLFTRGEAGTTLADIAVLSASPFLYVLLIAAIYNTIFLLPITVVSTYAAYLSGLVKGSKLSESPLLFTKKQRYITVSSAVILSVILCIQWNYRTPWILDYDYEEKTGKKISEDVDLDLYKPFTSSAYLTSLRTAPTLKISENYPRIDGATAAYPVYASAVQVIYQPKDQKEIDLINQLVRVSKTPVAYQRLFDGETDMLIVAQPSKSQLETARQKGVELNLIPVAKEAFVFIVNKDNAITELSVEQIQNIYAGRIDNWKKLGSPNKEILAFQRPDDSGSQSTMKAKVMKDTTMKRPLETEHGGSMGGVFHRVADYRNAENAIGYSFRYYATAMNKHTDIRLLSIDGIAPTVENIRNGSYPFTVDVYIVTAGEPTNETKAMTDWFLSPQGQQLIEDVGYIPIAQP